MASEVDLSFEMRPRDAGQIVEVTYAADWEAEKVICRVHDRSEGSGPEAVAFTVADMVDTEGESEEEYADADVFDRVCDIDRVIGREAWKPLTAKEKARWGLA